LTLSVTSIWDAVKLCQYNTFVSKDNHSRNEQQYCTALAVLTPILLFSRNVENFPRKNLIKDKAKHWILKNIPFVKIKISKLINYSTDMC
jgi:hypothetical protein